MSSTLAPLPVLDDVDTGNGPKVSHYAPKNQVTEAYVMGTEITAICGRRFVPSRNPDGLPICPECKSIKER